MNAWINLKSKIPYEDSNFILIIDALLFQCPSSYAKSSKLVSYRSNSFRDRKIEKEMLIRLLTIIKKLFNNASFKCFEKNEDVGEELDKYLKANKTFKDEDFEIVFFSKHSDMSIAESFYYCLRNSLAHGAFEIKESKHGKIYLFENRKEGKIKTRMRIKEKTMLDLVEISKIKKSVLEKSRKKKK